MGQLSKTKMNKIWQCLDNYEKTLTQFQEDYGEEQTEELQEVRECKLLVQHWE